MIKSSIKPLFTFVNYGDNIAPYILFCVYTNKLKIVQQFFKYVINIINKYYTTFYPNKVKQLRKLTRVCKGKLKQD